MIEIDQWTVGERCVVNKYFSLNEPAIGSCLEERIVPESLIVEMVSQASIGLIKQMRNLKVVHHD